MNQIDIFGNDVPVSFIETKPRKSIRQMFRDQCGYDHSHICKDCKHLVCNRYNYKNYYKCDLMGITDSEATDIRLKDVACGMWEKEERGS